MFKVIRIEKERDDYAWGITGPVRVGTAWFKNNHDDCENYCKFLNDVSQSGIPQPSEAGLGRTDPKQTERIACSAIWFQDGNVHVHQPIGIEFGFVVYGLGHHHVFSTLHVVEAKDGIKNLDSEQGFLTTWNRFVSREEAAKIAFLCGQSNEEHESLHSEDIFYRSNERK